MMGKYRNVLTVSDNAFIYEIILFFSGVVPMVWPSDQYF